MSLLSYYSMYNIQGRPASSSRYSQLQVWRVLPHFDKVNLLSVKASPFPMIWRLSFVNIWPYGMESVQVPRGWGGKLFLLGWCWVYTDSCCRQMCWIFRWMPRLISPLWFIGGMTDVSNAKFGHSPMNMKWWCGAHRWAKEVYGGGGL